MHNKTTLPVMSMPTFAMLPPNHPVVDLSVALRPNQFSPIAIEVLSLARFAPLECLNAFILMLCHGEWGSFWQHQFGRMVPSEEPRVTTAGCEAFGEYLRSQIDGAGATLPHDAVIAKAYSLLSPLEKELTEIVGFFSGCLRSPELGVPQVSARMAHPLKPDPLAHMGNGSRQFGGPSLTTRVDDPVIKTVPSIDTLVQQVQRGYPAMTLKEIVTALRGVRLSSEYMLAIEKSTKMKVSTGINKNSLTLAEVLHNLAALTVYPAKNDEAALIGKLCVALFDHERYIVTDPNGPLPLALANMLWALVVHCGYNLIHNNNNNTSPTATGLKVRANIFCRLVFERYQGRSCSALMNSLNGQITIEAKPPVHRWTALGFFPDLLKMIG